MDVTQSLNVDLNREHLHDIELSGPVFETSGSFEVVFRNHGRAVHVHVRLDDALSSVASVAGDNHFVDTDGETRVRVNVAPGSAPLAGSMELVTGYGSASERVRVHVEESEPDDGPVSVSEGLGERSAGRRSERVLPAGMAGVAMLVAPALVLAAVAVVVAPTPTVAAGALVLLSGVVVASYLRLR